MKVKCQECKNEKMLDDVDAQPGNWFECDYCGTTYEVSDLNDDGIPQLHMIEEEK